MLPELHDGKKEKYILYYLFFYELLLKIPGLNFKIWATKGLQEQKTLSANRAVTVNGKQSIHRFNLMRLYYPNEIMQETYGESKCTYSLVSVRLPLCVPHTDAYS